MQLTTITNNNIWISLMAQRIIIVHDNEQVKRRTELLLDNFLYFLQCANTHIVRQRLKFKHNHFQDYSVSFMVYRKIYEPHK